LRRYYHAETGHLVFATLHTNSAAQSIDRMIGFPPSAVPVRPNFMVFCRLFVHSVNSVIGGGRIAAAEIMIVTPAVRNIIRGRQKSHSIRCRYFRQAPNTECNL